MVKPKHDMLLPSVGVVVGVGCFALLAYYSDLALAQVAIPKADQTLDDWFVRQTTASFIAVAIGGMFALAWHTYTITSSGRRGDGRPIWATLGVLAFLDGLLTHVLLCPPIGTLGASLLASLIDVVVAVATFYVATAFFTVRTHKYAPLLGQVWRRS